VAITDKTIGVSQLLGARARAAPPKSIPTCVSAFKSFLGHVLEFLLQLHPVANRVGLHWRYTHWSLGSQMATYRTTTPRETICSLGFNRTALSRLFWAIRCARVFQ